MKTKKTIIITGTHHTPAIELIHLLKNDPQNNWNIIYIAHQYKTETHLTHTIIPKLGVEFINLECGKFDRKNLDKTIIGIPKTIGAFFKSISIIDKYQPHIVVSFGGYVSVPVVIAAAFKRVPSITHEQTLTNSLATRINSYFVTKVALSFNNQFQINQLPHHKTIVTGNLLRQEIFQSNSKLSKQITKPFVYFTGGNQGSIFLNELIYKIVPILSPKYTIVHQTGKNTQPHIQSELSQKYRYIPLEFVESEDIGWILNQAKAVISRSGANICQELNALDKKSLLIPHPFTQQNEQQKNAQWLRKLHPHSTIVISQSLANPKRVVRKLLKLLETHHISHPQKSSTSHPILKLVNEISL